MSLPSMQPCPRRFVLRCTCKGEQTMSDVTKLKEQLWKKLSDGPFMMVGLSNTHSHSEPLTAQLDRDQVDTIFFFIGKDNRLAQGGPAMAQFVSKGQDFFACLSGRVLIDNDRAMIDKLWSKIGRAHV